MPDGIRELYEAYRANGLTLEDLEGNRFMRIKRVAELLDVRPPRRRPGWTEGADRALPHLRRPTAS